LNRTRRDQAKKIDILCNDIVTAQRDFIRRLQTLSFVVDFYEALVGLTDLTAILRTTSQVIKNVAGDASVAFFLLEGHSFQVHVFDSEEPVELDAGQFGEIFTSELVRNICNSCKLCLAEDMFALGLQGSLSVLNKITFAGIPLSQAGTSVGFLLVYRSTDRELKIDDLNKIAAITPGLSRAVRSAQVVSHSAESK
jgi:transcriptional regulator with GAF, ATPase, and Fis domain